MIPDWFSYCSKIGIDESKYAVLNRYLEQLWTGNKELNLFSRKMEWDDLVHLHLIDSLLALPHWPQDTRHVVDLGSGGGFPAIPLALVLSDCQFVLVEKSPKKAAFLKRFMEWIPNLNVVCDLVPGGISAFTQVVTCRAFKPLPVIFEMTQAYLKNGGAYMLWKGRRETVEEELRASRRWLKGREAPHVLALSHPSRDVERNLVTLGLPR